MENVAYVWDKNWFCTKKLNYPKKYQRNKFTGWLVHNIILMLLRLVVRILLAHQTCNGIFHFVYLIRLDLQCLSFHWLGLSSCDGFLSFECISEEFGSKEEECIYFDLLCFSCFIQSISSLTRSSPLISSLTNKKPLNLNRTVQTWKTKASGNELILRFWWQFLRT